MFDGKYWLKDLRTTTKKEVVYCVGYLENVYLDNKDEEPITLENAIKYCYGYFVADQDFTDNVTRDIRFDGKKKVLEAIKQEILHNKYIRLDI